MKLSNYENVEIGATVTVSDRSDAIEYTVVEKEYPGFMEV